MEDILKNQEWLSQAPKYTIFRINKLKNFDCETLKNFFTAQRQELNSTDIPNYYLLRPDCLVIERWPPSLELCKADNEVIVDALCAAAVMRGAHVFAPGVMGLPTNCQLNERVDIYGDLEGHCKRGLKVKYDGQKIHAGTGHLKMLRNNLFDNGVQPSGIAVQTLLPSSRLPVVNEAIALPGEILLQNLPSIVCGWVVNAQPGECILDMCSAPGNKTTHLAEMAGNKAKIIAIDKTAQKVEKIRENCALHGVTSVKAYCYDSTKCWSEHSSSLEGPPYSSEHSKNIEGPPYPQNTFDKVLLDAPCSGLGQRPQLLNKMTPKMLESYKFVQRKLFSAAVNVLKVGGTLIYSTCTITQDENERMVAYVLSKYPQLKLVPAEPLYGGPGLPNCGLNDEQRAMVQRFGPEDDPIRPVEPIFRDTIGFFIAKFVKC